jgi:hypothetical protein
MTRPRVRITEYARHPMTGTAGVVVTHEQTRGRWQLIRSAFERTPGDPTIARFLAWAIERYPDAIRRSK